MKETNCAAWSEQGRNFTEGKTAYYIPSLDFCIKGKVINTYRDGALSIVTIKTKDGKTISDSSNRFSKNYPTILNYWKN